jgi:hypothetical protein
VNLAGIHFSEGIELTFGDVTLGPGERAVAVSNLAAFQLRYGTAIPVAGEYGQTVDAFRLANGGETIALRDAGGGLIQSFRYDDDWYPDTDGLGPSLVIKNALSSMESWNDPAAWRASYENGGSPGSEDDLPGDANGDLRVDLADVAVVQAYMGATGATRAQGDLDGDGNVGRSDAALAARNFGRSIVEPAPSAAAAIAVADRGAGKNGRARQFAALVASRRRIQADLADRALSEPANPSAATGDILAVGNRALRRALRRPR